MPIFEFTAAGQSSPVFVSGGDLDTKPGARVKVTHPDLKGATVTIEQQTDPWGNTMLTYPNIGADQYDYAPGFGPWSTCDAPIPLSAQPCKDHALPIGTGKITVFPGVASQAQIEEAK